MENASFAKAFANIDRSRLNRSPRLRFNRNRRLGSRANAARSVCYGRAHGWRRSHVSASRIRAGELGVNPFIGTIITVGSRASGDPPYRQLRHEDIIVKPLSPKQIMDRVNVVAFNRKPLSSRASTTARPRSGRKLKEGEEADPSDDVPRIEVPNTLGAKASVNLSFR